MTYDNLLIALKARLLVEKFNIEHLDKYQLHIKMLYKFLEENFILDEISPQYVSSHIDLLVKHIIALEVEQAPDYLRSDKWGIE